jgi:hypothetical protein
MTVDQLKDETDRKHAEREERRNRVRTYTDRVINLKRDLMEDLGDRARFVMKAPACQ